MKKYSVIDEAISIAKEDVKNSYQKLETDKMEFIENIKKNKIKKEENTFFNKILKTLGI